MKAILRVNYRNKGNFVFRFDNIVNSNTIYKLIDNLDHQFGYNSSYRGISFICDADNEEALFITKQYLFFNMVKMANLRFRWYFDDIAFHDKIKLFLTNESILYWLVGNDYSRLLEPNQLDVYKDQLLYDLNSGANLYKIDIYNGTIEEIEANNLVQVS